MRLLKVAKRMCVLRLARPGSAEVRVHCVSRRIDRPSSPVPFAQHSDGGQSRLAHLHSDSTHISQGSGQLLRLRTMYR
jgi:hypothetical protein